MNTLKTSEVIKTLEEQRVCAKARCERYADISAQTALTPKGDEFYNCAIRDYNVLSHAISVLKLWESAEAVLPKAKTTFYCDDSCDSCEGVMQNDICPKDVWNVYRTKAIVVVAKLQARIAELEKELT